MTSRNVSCNIIIIIIIIITTVISGSSHHSMARLQVADGVTASKVEGNCEYIE